MEEPVEVAQTLNNSAAFGSGNNPSTKRGAFESDLTNSREIDPNSGAVMHKTVGQRFGRKRSSERTDQRQIKIE